MRINSNLNTNFTSKVRLIDDFYQKPEQRLGEDNAQTLLKALNKIENNGRKDRVDVFILDTQDAPTIGLRVQKKYQKKVYEGKSTISLFYHQLKENDLYFAYSNALERAKSKESPVKESKFDKFIWLIFQ